MTKYLLLLLEDPKGMDHGKKNNSIKAILDVNGIPHKFGFSNVEGKFGGFITFEKRINDVVRKGLRKWDKTFYF